MPTISILTDFGHQDAYVGVMKGVIASRCPDVTVIDLCHEVEPQNVAQAAYLLETSFRYFPQGTVHVVVVDPGVGSKRRVICAGAQGHVLLAPDNGVLWPVVGKARDWLVSVTNADYFLDAASPTFHGRDIFAPVAAALASGVRATKLGEPIESLEPLAVARPIVGTDRALVGAVVHVDRFGNLITSFTDEWLAAHASDRDALWVHVGDVAFKRVRETYADVAPGELVALIGSTGRLEISVNLGSAAQLLGIGIGATVKLKKG